MTVLTLTLTMYRGNSSRTVNGARSQCGSKSMVREVEEPLGVGVEVEERAWLRTAAAAPDRDRDPCPTAPRAAIHGLLRRRRRG